MPHGAFTFTREGERLLSQASGRPKVTIEAVLRPREATPPSGGVFVKPSEGSMPIYLPLLRPLQEHMNLRTALRTLAGLARFHRLRLAEREVELEGFVLACPHRAHSTRILTTTGMSLCMPANMPPVQPFA